MLPIPVIIDTDPGVDDVCAIYLALAAKELDVKAITTTFGNADTNTCAKNAITILQVLERERRHDLAAQNRFGHVGAGTPPVIALGSQGPISGQRFYATYYHGLDGIQGIHKTHPHIFPNDPMHYFKNGVTHDEIFQTTNAPACDLILSTIKNHCPHKVVILAIGPLTNLAMAATKDPKTFAKVRQVIVMGGAVHVPGNVTPTAEFNFFADPLAASIIFKMTITHNLHVTLLPLDLTSVFNIRRDHLEKHISRDISSPLTEFCQLFISRTMDRIEHSFLGGVGKDQPSVSMEMHDAVAAWYAIDLARNEKEIPPGWTTRFMDIRIETTGTYTRGMCVVDSRIGASNEDDHGPVGGRKMDDEFESKRGEGVWVRPETRVEVIATSPGAVPFRKLFFSSVFGADPDLVD